LVIKMAPENEEEINLFEYNKYNNANLGEMPQRLDEDRPEARPEIGIPDVWLQLAEEDLKCLDIKGAIHPKVI
jgi:hypothetical protein